LLQLGTVLHLYLARLLLRVEAAAGLQYQLLLLVRQGVAGVAVRQRVAGLPVLVVLEIRLVHRRMAVTRLLLLLIKVFLVVAVLAVQILVQAGAAVRVGQELTVLLARAAMAVLDKQVPLQAQA
jgi:hypothetical protein